MLVRIHIIWKYLHGFTSILVGTWINHKITTILFIPSAKNNYSFHYFSISPYITVQFIWRDILESELLQLELVLFYLHSWNICRLCVFYLFNVATFEFVPFQFQSVPSSVRYIFASLKPIWHSHSLLLYWGVLQYPMTLLKTYTHTKARVQCTAHNIIMPLDQRIMLGIVQLCIIGILLISYIYVSHAVLASSEYMYVVVTA